MNDVNHDSRRVEVTTNLTEPPTMTDPWTAYAASISQAAEPAVTLTTNSIPERTIPTPSPRLGRGIVWRIVAAEIETDRLTFEAAVAQRKARTA